LKQIYISFVGKPKKPVLRTAARKDQLFLASCSNWHALLRKRKTVAFEHRASLELKLSL